MRSMAICTQTPAQIKKHAECFFKQNLKTNSAAVNQYQEFLLPDKKAQILVKHASEQQNIDSFSHQRTKFKYYAKMLMHIGNNESHFLLRKRSKF
jgi:hypothetical protein